MPSSPPPQDSSNSATVSSTNAELQRRINQATAHLADLPPFATVEMERHAITYFVTKEYNDELRCREQIG